MPGGHGAYLVQSFHHWAPSCLYIWICQSTGQISMDLWVWVRCGCEYGSCSNTYGFTHVFCIMIHLPLSFNDDKDRITPLILTLKMTCPFPFPLSKDNNMLCPYSLTTMCHLPLPLNNNNNTMPSPLPLPLPLPSWQWQCALCDHPCPYLSPLAIILLLMIT